MTIGPIPFDMLMRPIKYVELGGAVFVAASYPRQSVGGPKYAVMLRNQMQTQDAENNWQIAAEIEDEFTASFIVCGAYGDVGANPALGRIGKATFVGGG